MAEGVRVEEEGLLVEARELYRKAVRAYPEFPAPYENLAVLALEQRQTGWEIAKEIRQGFENISEEKKSGASWRVVLHLLNAEESYQKGKKPDAAVSLLKAARERLNPRFLFLFSEIAREGELYKPAKAARSYRKALYMIQEGEPQEGLTELESADELLGALNIPGARSLVEAMAHIGIKDYEKAKSKLTQALERGGSPSLIYRWFGALFKEWGDEKKALFSYQKAWGEDSWDTETAVWIFLRAPEELPELLLERPELVYRPSILAKVLEQANNKNDSRVAVFSGKLLLSLLPDNREGINWNLLVGHHLKKLDRAGEAKPYLEKVLKLDPDGEKGSAARRLLGYE